MMRDTVVKGLLISLLTSVPGLAHAAPSCTEWMRQKDGSSERVCVDDKGRRYCESLKNGKISRISC